MLRQPSCQYCRWFSVLRDGAVIGRCRNDTGGIAFPRKEACCPQFEAERRTHDRGAGDEFEPPPSVAVTGRPRRT